MLLFTKNITIKWATINEHYYIDSKKMKFSVVPFNLNFQFIFIYDKCKEIENARYAYLMYQFQYSS